MSACVAPETRTPLMVAAATGDLERVIFLIHSGTADLDAVDDTGKTALMHACTSGAAEVISALTAAGADVTARDHRGWTAIEWGGPSFSENRLFRLLHLASPDDVEEGTLSGFQQATVGAEADQDH